MTLLSDDSKYSEICVRSKGNKIHVDRHGFVDIQKGHIRGLKKVRYSIVRDIFNIPENTVFEGLR